MARLEVKSEVNSEEEEEENRDEEAESTCSNERTQSVTTTSTVGSTKKKGWTWNNYLEKTKATKMPIKSFKEVSRTENFNFILAFCQPSSF